MARRNASAPFGTAADWGVVAFAAGIAVYFGLGFEPRLEVLVWTGALGALALWAAGRAGVDLRGCVGALLVVAGLARAAWHTRALAHTILPERPAYHEVVGWVEAVERGSSGLRWIVRVEALDGVADPPPRVRVNVADESVAETVRAGDGVAFRARLYRPPPPALPGGYDSARAAYFRRIGAYGQLVGAPRRAALELGPRARAERALTRLRYRIAARIQARAPPDTAGLQVALITGIRKSIPAAQLEAMRDAGLAHIVAISGLHMAVFAGYAYTVASLLFALTPLARRRDMRKPAALIALGVASGYLFLSGASVSTQRAFVMIAVWLVAIVIEREPFSLRSVSVAAFLTLALRPESLLSAGFHMSFAAVAALIVAYGAWSARRERLPRGPVRRVAEWFGGLAATSVIAGAATAGFAAIHFGRMARYGLAGNLAAMPIFTAVTMPAAMLSLLAMPLGLEAVPLRLMGWSLEAVLDVATHVADWPGAVAHTPGATRAALLVFAAGLILLLVGRGRMRMAGLATLALVPLGAIHQVAPSLRVSERGVTTVLRKGRLYGTSPRSDRFGRSLFAERAGLATDALAPEDPTPLERLSGCTDRGCRLRVDGHMVAILHHPEDVAEACRISAVVILTERAATPVARRHCDAVLIDADTLAIRGNLDIRFQPDPHVKGSKDHRAGRPWSE